MKQVILVFLTSIHNFKCYAVISDNLDDYIPDQNLNSRSRILNIYLILGTMKRQGNFIGGQAQSFVKHIVHPCLLPGYRFDPRYIYLKLINDIFSF